MRPNPWARRWLRVMRKAILLCDRLQKGGRSNAEVSAIAFDLLEALTLAADAAFEGDAPLLRELVERAERSLTAAERFLETGREEESGPS